MYKVKTGEKYKIFVVVIKRIKKGSCPKITSITLSTFAGQKSASRQGKGLIPKDSLFLLFTFFRFEHKGPLEPGNAGIVV